MKLVECLVVGLRIQKKLHKNTNLEILANGQETVITIPIVLKVVQVQVTLIVVKPKNWNSKVTIWILPFIVQDAIYTTVP